jgi:hypothetical protein
LGNIASANRFPTIIPAARFDDRCISRIFVWGFASSYVVGRSLRKREPHTNAALSLSCPGSPHHQQNPADLRQ